MGIQTIKGGWHFSFLQKPEDIALKIKSYSHGEFNTKENVDKEKIQSGFTTITNEQMSKRVEDMIAQKAKEVSTDDNEVYEIWNKMGKPSKRKFDDADRKEVNLENLASSYNALEKKLGSRTEDLSKQVRQDLEQERLGKTPEEYNVTDDELKSSEESKDET